MEVKLISGATIKSALRDVCPNYIAVAYIGADWESYINISHLKEIVISPTLGSNPNAIRDIVGKLKWENVHFLDELHAKIYIGKDQAAVGSFNLTENGLSSYGLEEAGFLVRDNSVIDELKTLYDRYKLTADAQHPTKFSKEEKLDNLQATWNRALAEGVVRQDNLIRSLSSFDPGTAENFYICWYRDIKVKYNDHVIGNAMPEYEADLPNKVIDSFMNFLDGDAIQENKWALCWKVKNNDCPSTIKPHWIYIHQIIASGISDEPYTKLAIQRKDKKLPPEPFVIDEAVSKAVIAVLNSGLFPEFLNNKNDEPWSINETIPRFKQFILAMKATLVSNVKNITFYSAENYEKNIGAEGRARTIAAFHIAQNNNTLTNGPMRADVLKILMSPKAVNYWKNDKEFLESCGKHENGTPLLRLTKAGLSECSYSLIGRAATNTSSSLVRAWRNRMMKGDSIAIHPHTFDLPL